MKDHRFVDKDAVIDVMRTAYLDSNLMAHEIADRGRLAHSTVDNILYGKTRRPQHHTVTQFFAALGVEVVCRYEKGRAVITARAGVGRQFLKKPARGQEKRRREELRAVS